MNLVFSNNNRHIPWVAEGRICNSQPGPGNVWGERGAGVYRCVVHCGCSVFVEWLVLLIRVFLNDCFCWMINVFVEWLFFGQWYISSNDFCCWTINALVEWFFFVEWLFFYWMIYMFVERLMIFFIDSDYVDWMTVFVEWQMYFCVLSSC